MSDQNSVMRKKCIYIVTNIFITWIMYFFLQTIKFKVLNRSYRDICTQTLLLLYLRDCVEF